MAGRINKSEMDFDQIKTNLIRYMKEQEGPIADYNYEGSAVNTIIDVLSYMTHVNAVNANLALNETFLDTAQLRESVVSHAKLLGYTPRSRRSAKAYLTLTINGKVDGTGVPSWNITSDGNNTPMDYTIPYGTEFQVIRDGFTETFTVVTPMKVSPINNVWTFNNLEIVQGTSAVREYKYNPTTSERYLLYDTNVDTTTLKVDTTNSSSSAYSDYVLSSNLVEIKSNSRVYFLEESREGFFEVKFGDGIIGERPLAGDTVRLRYIVTGPKNVNGASRFTLVSSLTDNTGAGNTSTQLSNITAASGGSARENNESIKYNAPRMYTAQNRAVTPEDYRTLVIRQYADARTVAVWGGEDQVVPEYGTVYISVKPNGANTLTDQEKSDLILALNKFNVISITPKILDPNIIKVRLATTFRYNPNITNLNVSDLSDKIKANIETYNDKNLDLFGGVFRSSNVTSVVDNADVSIISNVTLVTMSQALTPTIGATQDHTIEFNQALAEISAGSKIDSSPFTYGNHLNCKLKDYYNAGSSTCVIQVVNGDGSVINPNVGDVEPSTGKITLVDFKVDGIVGSSSIDIYTRPDSPDIKPTRNDILSIDLVNLAPVGIIDTMATGGSSTGVSYQTTSGSSY